MLRPSKKGNVPIYIYVPIFVVLLLIAAQPAGAGEPVMVTVTGTTDEPCSSVMVNGIAAARSGTTFTAANVPLTYGTNAITAVATDVAGNASTASMTVTVAVDMTIQGAIDDNAALVTVNGVAAAVTSGTFSAKVRFVPGRNRITATAKDTAGNQSAQSMDIFVARAPVKHP